MNYKVLLLFLILNAKLTYGIFLVNVKKQAIDRLTNELFPHIQRKLLKPIEIPTQKVRGLELNNLLLNLNIPNAPQFSLQPEKNRTIITLTDVGATMSAKLVIKIFRLRIATNTTFKLGLKSIGFGINLLHQKEPREFSSKINFEHVDVDCKSINITFENGKLNWMYRTVFKLPLLRSLFSRLKKKVCKKVKKFVSISGRKSVGEKLARGLNKRANTFLPMEIPVSTKQIIHLEGGDDVQVLPNSILLPLNIVFKTPDGTEFEKTCTRDDYNFYSSVPFHSDFIAQIPECYIRDYMNILVEEEKGLVFPRIEYEVQGEKIDAYAVMYQDPRSYVKAHNGYISLVAKVTLKIVYEQEFFFVDTLAEAEIRLSKIEGFSEDETKGEMLDIRKYTKNAHAHFTNKNVSTWIAKINLINLKEYDIRDNGVDLPEIITIKNVIEFYIKNYIKLEKKLRINRLCTFKQLCFDSFDFEIVEGMVLAGLSFNDEERYTDL